MDREPLLFASRPNPDFGSGIKYGSSVKYIRWEDEKSISFSPCDGRNTTYKFHKKTGVGVVVTEDSEGNRVIKFIG